MRPLFRALAAVVAYGTTYSVFALLFLGAIGLFGGSDFYSRSELTLELFKIILYVAVLIFSPIFFFNWVAYIAIYVGTAWLSTDKATKRLQPARMTVSGFVVGAVVCSLVLPFSYGNDGPNTGLRSMARNDVGYVLFALPALVSFAIGWWVAAHLDNCLSRIADKREIKKRIAEQQAATP